MRDLKSINEIIIPHFYLYPLISQKQEDFLIFSLRAKKIVEALRDINNKQHLEKNGFINILKLKYNHNKGLTIDLKNILIESIEPNNIENFNLETKLSILPRPKFVIKEIFNPY